MIALWRSPVPSRDGFIAQPRRGLRRRGANARRSSHKPLLCLILVLQLQRPVFCGAVPGGYPTPEPSPPCPAHHHAPAPEPPWLESNGNTKAHGERQDASTAVPSSNNSAVPPLVASCL